MKRLKAQVSKYDVGTKISKIRQTKAGGILIELQREARLGEVEAAIMASLGDEVAVRALQQSVTLQVRDIDVDTTAKEVAGAFLTALAATNPDKEVAVKALRPAFKGTQLAVVALSRAAAQIILTDGKIRIGWVNARVRERRMVLRCYSCLGYGHIAADYKEAKSSKLCFKCGEDGQLAAACAEAPRCVQC